MSDLREDQGSEIVLDPELALMMEAAAFCLRGWVNSLAASRLCFVDEVVLDKVGDREFA